MEGIYLYMPLLAEIITPVAMLVFLHFNHEAQEKYYINKVRTWSCW